MKLHPSIFSLGCLSLVLPCMATSVPPIPVEQKVRSADHIFIGVATQLVITDRAGQMVSFPQTEVQSNDACRLTIEIVEVIKSNADPVPKSITVTYRNKWIRKVEQEQKVYVGKRMIYLLCGKDFVPVNSFQFVEPVESVGVIKKLVQEQTERRAEPAAPASGTAPSR